MSEPSRHAGFTLLEVLVALVVLGLLLLALRQGVAVGLRASDTQARLIAGREDLDSVARALRRLVEHMDPGTETEPARIDAGAHAIWFPTELPAAASALAGRAVDAALLVNAGHELVLRWTRRLHAVRLDAPPPVQETELLRGVERLDLAYWRREAAGGGRWTAGWSGPDIPALVRVRIVFPPGDPRHWPDVVAAPARERPHE